MFKRFLLLIVVLIALISAWLAFALWSGMYSVYSIPPSRDAPEGMTLLVSREQREPMFNSPGAAQLTRRGGDRNPGQGFESTAKLRKPLPQRTIVRLPYIEWAYRKSLEPPSSPER